MRLAGTLVAILVAVLFASPRVAAAQEPVASFDQLNTRLKPGDTIWVTDAQGREVKGKIVDVAPGVLTLKADGAKTYTSGDVNLIRERQHDSLANGTLIGLGVGGLGVGLACLASVDGDEKGWCLAAALVYGGVGAAVGLGIDAMIPGKKLVAYRAPRTPGSSQSRLSIAPVITPRAKGMAVAFSF